jgi:hypothetical protein
MTELPRLARPSNCRTAMTLPLADKLLRNGDESTLLCLMPRQGHGQHKVESEAEITAKMNLNGQSSQVYIRGEHRPQA